MPIYLLQIRLLKKSYFYACHILYTFMVKCFQAVILRAQTDAESLTYILVVHRAITVFI